MNEQWKTEQCLNEQWMTKQWINKTMIRIQSTAPLS